MKKNLMKLTAGVLFAIGVFAAGNMNLHAEAASDVLAPIHVKGGQTLNELAAAYGVTVEDWTYTNGLTSDELTPGQELHIPLAYKVTAGDQLWYLADRYGTTVERIMELNGLQDAKSIEAGQVIVIPTGDVKEVAVAKAPVAEKATVAPAKAPVAEKATVAKQATQVAPSDTTVATDTKLATNVGTVSQAVTEAAAKTAMNLSAADKERISNSGSLAAKAAKVWSAISEPTASTAPAPVATQTVPTVAGLAYAKEVNMTASAYGPGNVMWQWGGLTYTGTKIREGVIAVDPSVIPLGSKVYVTGYNSPLLPAGGFVATAEDTGGAIKGNRIDIYIDGTQAQLREFGMQDVKLYLLK
ncbi:MAG TPA: LysM peptidoglycan-binding domain-containing protein [Bacilli bacterium]|nr:LysM peptidoglycan-binding domain-containing protein [Bacilli bacterium]